MSSEMAPARVLQLLAEPNGWQPSGGSRRRWRVLAGPEDYFGSAYAILAESGPAGLKISTMCERECVTKGSFYYHFTSFDHFIAAFLEAREAAFNQALTTVMAAPSAIQRLSAAVTAISNLPHAAEVAIRAWACSEPRVAASQERLDLSVVSAAAEIASELDGQTEAAATIARHTLALVVGMQHFYRDAPTVAESVLTYLCGALKVTASIEHLGGSLVITFSGPPICHPVS